MTRRPHRALPGAPWAAALAIAVSLLGACATAPAPAAQTPATTPPAPAAPPTCPEVDASRIGDAARYDRENQESQAKVRTLERVVTELREQLAAVEARAGAAPPAPGPAVKTSKRASARAPAPDSSAERSDATVAQSGGRVRVRLANELLFKVSGVHITLAGRRALSAIARVLRETPSQRIEVNGHSDDTPAGHVWKDNWRLSLERAHQVLKFLIARGIEPGRLVASGFADTSPVDPGRGAAARQRNRRVELWLDPLPDAPAN